MRGVECVRNWSEESLTKHQYVTTLTWESAAVYSARIEKDVVSYLFVMCVCVCCLESRLFCPWFATAVTSVIMQSHKHLSTRYENRNLFIELTVIWAKWKPEYHFLLKLVGVPWHDGYTVFCIEFECKTSIYLYLFILLLLISTHRKTHFKELPSPSQFLCCKQTLTGKRPD